MSGAGDRGEYNPFAFVPGRIDAVSASGLKQLHAALSERNRAKLVSLPIEEQAALLWNLVEHGAVDVDLRWGER